MAGQGGALFLPGEDPVSCINNEQNLFPISLSTPDFVSFFLNFSSLLCLLLI